MADDLSIRWSMQAIRQIQKIGQHIELDSPWQARRVVQRLYAVPERLAWSPTKGTVVPEFRDPKLREVSVSSWRVIYRLENPGGIEIVAVVHGRRLLTEDLLG